MLDVLRATMSQFEGAAVALQAVDPNDDVAARRALDTFAHAHSSLSRAAARVNVVAWLDEAEVRRPRRWRWGSAIIGDPPAPNSEPYYVLAWLVENGWAIADVRTAIDAVREALGGFPRVTPRSLRSRLVQFASALERLRGELPRINPSGWIGTPDEEPL